MWYCSVCHEKVGCSKIRFPHGKKRGGIHYGCNSDFLGRMRWGGSIKWHELTHMDGRRGCDHDRLPDKIAPSGPGVLCHDLYRKD